jgi:hypothetical protein
LRAINDFIAGKDALSPQQPDGYASQNNDEKRFDQQNVRLDPRLDTDFDQNESGRQYHGDCQRKPKLDLARVKTPVCQ